MAFHGPWDKMLLLAESRSPVRWSPRICPYSRALGSCLLVHATHLGAANDGSTSTQAPQAFPDPQLQSPCALFSPLGTIRVHLFVVCVQN